MTGLLCFAIIGTTRQIRGNDHICPLMQCHFDRQIGHQPTVNVGLAIHFHRRKDSGCRHAGADGQVQGASVKHLHFAIPIPGGHRSERNFQVIEIDLRRDMRS